MNIYAINICTNPSVINSENKLAINPYPIIVVGTEEELYSYLTSNDMNEYIKNIFNSKELYNNSVYKIKVVQNDYWMREFELKIPEVNKIAI